MRAAKMHKTYTQIKCTVDRHLVMSLYVEKPPITAMAARHATIPENQANP